MKTRSIYFLCYLFQNIPKDILYLVSKYLGKYITFKQQIEATYKTKNRKDKYFVKHKIRAYSI